MMRSFYMVCVVGCGLMFVGHPVWAMASSPLSERASRVHEEWRGDTWVYRNAEWELCITYLHRGTRSEGQHGVLKRNGKPVEPEAPGAVLETPLGVLRHYGNERKRLWDMTGWNFADRARIVPSAARQSQNVQKKKGGMGAVSKVVEIQVTAEGGEFRAFLPLDSELRVVMQETPGTGYAWALIDGDWHETLQMKKERSVLEEDRSGQKLGGAQRIIWSFRPRHKGKAVLAFHYRRAWETDVPPLHQAVIHVEGK